MAKLTEDDVREIRADQRTYLEIGDDYGVAANTVYRIKARKRWGHVAD